MIAKAFDLKIAIKLAFQRLQACVVNQNQNAASHGNPRSRTAESISNSFSNCFHIDENDFEQVC